MILAALLRLPTFGSPLVEDEGIMFNRYSGLPWNVLLFNYDNPNQHTLYLILSDFCISIFGKNETAFRLPSFFAGLFAVFLIYRVGTVLLQSKVSPAVAGFLLCLSATHLKYSQEGRGYALTVFLGLLMALAALRGSAALRGWMWGAVLVGSGILMVLTLPSNLVFLAVVTTLFIANLWLNKNRSGPFFNRDVIRSFIPLIILFVLAGGYLYIIRNDLFSDAATYSQGINFSRLLEITGLLASPWGFWVYFAVALGVWNLRQEKKYLSFALVFFVPIIFTLATGIMGFARVYIYWLPFILLLAAHGMVSAVTVVRSFNVAAGYVLTIILTLALTIQSADQLAHYYPARAAGAFTSGGPNPVMAEAEEVSKYLEENFSDDHLILVMASGPESSVLNHYLGERVRRSMLRFATGERIAKIILICHKEVPPENYEIKLAAGVRRVQIPERLTTLLKMIGSLHIYSLDLNVSRLMPQVFDPDYDAELESRTSEELTIERVNEPHVAGQRLLALKNRTSKTLSAVSPTVKTVNNLGRDAFILTVYITVYGEQTISVLADKDNWPPTTGYLNYYLGVFKLPGSGVRWHVVYLLSPLKEGVNHLREIVQVKGNQTVHLDALQSFVLAR